MLFHNKKSPEDKFWENLSGCTGIPTKGRKLESKTEVITIIN